MSSFTPGPWKFKYHMNIDGAGIMEAEFDVTADDLKIIAAAPEMCKLLREAECELRHASMHPFGTDDKDAESEKETADEIAALLRRIEGEE